MEAYLRPGSLEDALMALEGDPRTILAGGTDFYPARVGKPLRQPVLDISAISGLRGITDQGAEYRIGALTTWSDLIRCDLPPWFDGLKLAAREVGGVQVQNAGTLCGNVCNASPAADGVPNLLALDARVELSASGSRREMPLAAFIVGNRKTQRAPNELVTALLLPKPGEAARGTFLKLGARKYLVISIVMVAVVVVPEPDGSVADARVAVGACSAVAKRLPELEAALRGRRLGEVTVRPEHLAALAPIDDLRGTAAYRLDAARTLVARALARLSGPV